LYRPFCELSSTCPTFTELLNFILPTGNGYITTDVLREIISELDPNLDYEELNEMIEEIDSDGSGTIDFDGEFIELNRPCLFCQSL
jgi:Ca2+-binding protein (EF-Hand superfamily)